jgi:hypothetical protein
LPAWRPKDRARIRRRNGCRGRSRNRTESKPNRAMLRTDCRTSAPVDFHAGTGDIAYHPSTLIG